MANHNYHKERILLKRCSEEDMDAQRKFADLSYLNTIHRCLVAQNLQYNRPLSDAEIEDVFHVVVTEVYSAYATLPHSAFNLYDRITAYAIGAARKAFDCKAAGKQQ